MDDNKKVLTVEEARQELRLSKGAIYAAIRTGELASIRLGRRILISRAVVDRLLNPEPQEHQHREES